MSPFDASDFGIINPDGTTRPCAADLSQWNRPGQSGLSVVLADAGTGTNTSTMPMVQVGDYRIAAPDRLSSWTRSSLVSRSSARR